MSICITDCHQFHSCLHDHSLDCFYGIRFLYMFLLTLLIQSVFSWKKKCQFIYIQGIFPVITVLPDKASVLSVLSNSRIADHIPVFMDRIHIKNEQPARIQIIIYQRKKILQIFLVRQIIHTVTDTDHSTNRTIQLKILHILQKIQNIMTGFCPLLHSLCKHLLRIIDTDHIISGICKHLCHSTCSTSQLQNQTIPDPVLSQCFYNIVCPFTIVYIIHENIINTGKSSI